MVVGPRKDDIIVESVLVSAVEQFKKHRKRSNMVCVICLVLSSFSIDGSII